MHRLSPSDYDALLDYVRELHAFRDLATLRLWLLDIALPRLLPSDWISYNEVNLHSPRETQTWMRPSPSSVMGLLPRFAELSHQHPVIAGQMNQRDLSVRRISDFLPRSGYQKLDLYQEVYRPMEVEYQMSAALETRRGFITAFALSRKGRDYSERDRALLEHLRGQLLVAMRNLSAAEQARNLSGDYARALARYSVATLTFNQRGDILHHDGGALKWLGLAEGTPLPANLLAWAKCQRADPRDLNPRQGDLRLPYADGQLVIQALPSQQSNHTLLTLTCQPARGPTPLSNGFGLSKREAEVARWIGEGKTNAQIALILSISPRTVQKHVEHIFNRLGVESRLGVALRLLEPPPASHSVG